MSEYTNFGGTVTITIGAGTPLEFSGEVLSFTVNHPYRDVGENRTMMNGDKRKGQKVQDPDSVTFTFEPDLTGAGLYEFVQSNNLAKADLSYKLDPQTGGPVWEGEVELTLPETVDGTEYGVAVVGSCTWACTGSLAFTPAT